MRTCFNAGITTLQMRAVTTRFNSTRRATGCTKTIELTGSPQPKDVSQTVVDWPSLMTTFDNTFPARCFRRRIVRGLV